MFCHISYDIIEHAIFISVKVFWFLFPGLNFAASATIFFVSDLFFLLNHQEFSIFT